MSPTFSGANSVLCRLSCYQWAQLRYEAARKMISLLGLTTTLGRLIATISVLCFFGEACKIVAFHNNMLAGIFIAQALLLKHHEYNLSIISKRQKSQRGLCGPLILSLYASFSVMNPELYMKELWYRYIHCIHALHYQFFYAFWLAVFFCNVLLFKDLFYF